jgi:hypothetical protein
MGSLRNLGHKSGDLLSILISETEIRREDVKRAVETADSINNYMEQNPPNCGRVPIYAFYLNFDLDNEVFQRCVRARLAIRGIQVAVTDNARMRQERNVHRFKHDIIFCSFETTPLFDEIRVNDIPENPPNLMLEGSI